MSTESQDTNSFEATLRQVTPNNGCLSAEETFYAAGRKAAQAEFQNSPALVDRPPSRLRTFAGGLVCGVACSVIGFVMWQPVDDAEGPNVVDQQIPDVTESVVKTESPRQAMAEPEPDDFGHEGLNEVLALLRPANWLAVDLHSTSWMPSATRMNAGGIRIDGTGMLGMATPTMLPEKSTADVVPVERWKHSVEQLRVFPLSNELIDELL